MALAHSEALLTPRLWHYSGGLYYHWRAFRYRQVLWAPFVAQVQVWLESWHVPEERLLIVGPSAGYTLSAHWLARFRRIDILEPDPFACWLLRRRFPGICFHQGSLDCFASSAGPEMLRKAYPDSAVLFSNVIGQQRRLESIAAWKEALLTSMRQQSWASYHDIISTSVAPAFTGSVRMRPDAPLEEVLSCFWRGGELSLYDHGCHPLLEQETCYATWSITPRQHHLVGWNCMIVV